MPFRKVIGIEISPELVAVCRDNLKRFRARFRNSTEFEVRCADASRFDVPEGDFVVFLFNPFSATLIAALVAHLECALSAAPRRAYIVYVNPLHTAALDRARFFRKLFCNEVFPVYAIYEAK